MVRKVRIGSSIRILEPSAGDGRFIDEILREYGDVRIDALDINAGAIDVLKRKYAGNPRISIRLTDTLLDHELDEYCNEGGYYDRIIANPPYGAWQDYEKRAILKEKYGEMYDRESYALFMYRCFTVLKKGGRMSFIVPATYLFLKQHERLRKVLLKNSCIEEILIFPSKLFTGASFCYSDLSIITLEKSDRDKALENSVRIVSGFTDPAGFTGPEGRYEQGYMPQVFIRKQSDILAAQRSSFVLADDRTGSIISGCEMKIGDVADVVTGFYSGDNKRFVRVLDDIVKGSKKYGKVDPDMIFECTSLSGIKGVTEGYVPYIKGTPKTRYFRARDEWFIRWDEQTVSYYKNNKKTRFQNPDRYFERGIAVPLVKAGKIRATLMENRIFDQSVVGIFPVDRKYLYYMLALMNSDTVLRLIRAINPTANNSASYIRQIPYREPSAYYRKIIDRNVEKILGRDFGPGETAENLHEMNNRIIGKIYTG